MTPLLSNALLRAQSDDRLTALASAGHDRAFEAIVERYRRPLLRHVRRLLPDARAEDVVQAAFVSAWGSLRSDTEVRELRPWLYRIATNGALNALKRSGADDAPLGAMAEATHAGGDPGAEVERRDTVRRALTGLAALPERQRDALVATALAGRPHAEVAAELGMSDGALRQLVHRARSQLRAVATTFTPPPLLAAAAGAHELTAARVAEVAAGAGGAGIAATGLKLGAVATTAAALVAGAPHVARLDHGDGPPGRPAAGAAVPSPADATPVVAATPAADVAATDPGGRERRRGRRGAMRRPHAGGGHGAAGRRHAQAPAADAERGDDGPRHEATAGDRSGTGSRDERSGDDGRRHDSSESGEDRTKAAETEHEGSAEDAPEPAAGGTGDDPADPSSGEGSGATAEATDGGSRDGATGGETPPAQTTSAGGGSSEPASAGDG